MGWASCALAGAFWLARADAAAAEPPPGETAAPQAPPDLSPAPRRADLPQPAPQPLVGPPWPQLASLVPGVLVHGSGTWLQGRTLTTERFLLLEASALLALLAGGLVIYETGAARDYAGAATLMVGAGVGTFGASFLANVYATAAPGAGWGEPQRRLPWLVAGLGYTYVDDVQFEHQHFATTRLDGRVGSWHVLLEAMQAPSAQNQWLGLQAGYRLLGPRAAASSAPDGSYLEPRLQLSRHAFGEDGFVSRVFAVELDGRLDSQRLLPDVHGAFFQAAAGLGRQWVDYTLAGADPRDSSGLLLLHVGFGLYLGRRGGGSGAGPAQAGSELELYYDHRRDGLSGGIETRGATSGFAGHTGLVAQWFITPEWGLRALGEVGSSWVLGLAALLRLGPGS